MTKIRRFGRRATASIALAAMVMLAPAARAADAPRVTDERAREIVDMAAETIRNLYVEADKGAAIASELRSRANAGRYDGAGTVSVLADRLSADLQEIGKDKHLSARFDPREKGSRRIVVTPDDAKPTGGPNDHGPIRVVRGEGPPHDPERAERARRTNFGLRSVERLDGNVGYIAISEFAPLALARDTVAAAMAFVASSDAIIVDLRDCPGGSADTVSFLASYFFPAGRKELFSRVDRAAGETRVEHTYEDLPGRRLPDTEVFVLVGPGTASAGESFAYLLQGFGRATVVGERTAGAGYNVAILPLTDGIVLGVSVAKPVHPKTGRGWEGEGVQPDVRASTPDALAAAHAAALRRLASKTEDERRRRELGWALERVTSPRRVSAAELAALAGRYGERTVTVEGGRLVCRAPNGRSRTLDPVGADGFTWDEETRATFSRDAAGRPSAFVLERSDGVMESFPRRADVAAKEETR